jgi:cysteine synthase
LVRQAQIDDVVMVPEPDTVAGCHELMDRHGVFAGGSSGSVYTAINRYLHPLRVWRKKPNVLFLCADRGFPYLKTIYNPSWVSWLQEQHGH